MPFSLPVLDYTKPEMRNIEVVPGPTLGSRRPWTPRGGLRLDFVGLRLLLVWFHSVIHGREVASFSFCLFGFTFNKRQVRNKDSLQHKAEVTSISTSLFRAILIGFCYCAAVDAHFPGVPARGNDRFCGDLTAAVVSGPFPRVQPKQEPLLDQPL